MRLELAQTDIAREFDVESVMGSRADKRLCTESSAGLMACKMEIARRQRDWSRCLLRYGRRIPNLA